MCNAETETSAAFAPEAKVLAAIFIVLSIGMQRGFYFVTASIVALTLTLWVWVEGVRLKPVLLRSLGFLPFLLMATFFGPGGPGVGAASMTLLARGLTSAITLAVLSCTTPFHNLLDGLGRLRVPATFLMILAFMFRYLETLRGEARRMERARNLRFFGRGYGGQFAVLGYMISNLFLRSYERGERVYSAMRLRGYTGESEKSGRATFGPRGIALVGLAAISVVATGVNMACHYLR